MFHVGAAGAAPARPVVVPSSALLFVTVSVRWLASSAVALWSSALASAVSAVASAAAGPTFAAALLLASVVAEPAPGVVGLSLLVANT